MTTQIFVATTAFGLVTVVAAIDDGAFAIADRRILVISNNSAEPEVTPGLAEVVGIATLLDRFDDIYDYNEAIAPQHPSLWRPRAVDLPLLERYFTGAWSLSGDLHLIVESIQASPAQTLCQVFHDARIDVYADGLMSYGPTRDRLRIQVASRIERLLHLDLVPGLNPVLLTEFDVPPVLISTESFRKVVATLDNSPALITESGGGQVAVLLGQYLAPASILTEEEEHQLHVKMVRGAVTSGFTRLIFKPHPSAPAQFAQPLIAEAEAMGAQLVVHAQPELVETWFRHESIGLVVGCFSTGLATAAHGYGLPTGRVGTHLLLERLTPYQNSNRVPVTIVDAVIPHVLEVGSRPMTADIDAIVKTVSYCMQPTLYPQLRSAAVQLLGDRYDEVYHYFKRRRLTQLDLPGRLATPVRDVNAPTHPATRLLTRLIGPRRAKRVRGVVDTALVTRRRRPNQTGIRK